MHRNCDAFSFYYSRYIAAFDLLFDLYAYNIYIGIKYFLILLLFILS